MNIGLFDSGIGGLSVLKQVVLSTPKNRFIYLADTANLPYGNKTQEQI
jgi:glutamate racemase